MDTKKLKKVLTGPKVTMTVSIPKALLEAIDKDADQLWPGMTRSVYVVRKLAENLGAEK